MNLAATTIAFNINTLAFMPMIGIGIAVSVLVGRHIGRGDPETASRSTYSGFFLTFVYMGVVALLYVAVPGLFTAPFAHGPKRSSSVRSNGLPGCCSGSWPVLALRHHEHHLRLGHQGSR